MSQKRLFLCGVVALSILLLTSFLVMGEGISDKLSRVIRLELGLDSDVYRVIETEYRGQRIILITIFGNDKALNSSLGADIKSAIRENKGQTPLAISVLARDKEVKFHPYALRVVQGNEETSPKSVIGITDDFKHGATPEKVPIGGEVFWGSKGVVTLGEDFDTSSSFRVKYGTSSASFSLTGQGQGTGLEQATPGDQGKSGNEKLGTTNTNPGDESSKTNTNDSSAPHSSRTGQGFALLAQLATLLSITLSLL